MLDLSSILSLEELKKRAFQIKPNRGQWILGFGWDQSVWTDAKDLHYTSLDQAFPNNPVALSRVDGHSLWVNSAAMKLGDLNKNSLQIPIPGGRVEVDAKGEPTGILVDAAKDIIETKIPKPTETEIKKYLVQGMEIFHNAGFTHIRDVGGCLRDWQFALELEESGQLHLFCEMYFNLDRAEDLSLRIQEVQSCRNHGAQQLRQAGIKFYFDGALGSNGAFLSRPYSDGSTGIRLYELAKIEEIMHRCWEKNIPVAIHTLGDEAVHQVVLVAHRLKERGIEGNLNLEHCQVVRPETISLMRALRVRCHLQPCHFLSDSRWLKEKLGELYKFSFPWRRLIECGIPINFGSDSPIEVPSLSNTQKALELACHEGIALPPISPWFFHSHPDGAWGGNCVTRLSSDGTTDVRFCTP